MRRIVLCGWLVLGLSALGAEEPGPVDTVKEGFKTAGKAVGETAVKVGHAVRDGAKATKEGVKKAGKAVGAGAKKVGHGVKEGAQDVGHGVKEGAKEVRDKVKGSDSTPET
jgi:hypothetical protein